MFLNCANLLSDKLMGYVSVFSDAKRVYLVYLASEKIEPPRGKTNNVVSEQVQYKPACTRAEKS